MISTDLSPSLPLLPAPSSAFPPLSPNPAPFPNSPSSAVGSLPHSALCSLDDSLRGIRSYVYLLAKTYLDINTEGKDYHKLLEKLEKLAGYSS